MPVLSNARHERFAQEIAGGENITNAHEKAGYKRHEGNASTLAGHPDIKARVEEIRAKVVAKMAITAESLAEEASELQRLAAADKQYGPANAALKLKAELLGKYVQRKEDVTPRRNQKQIDTRILELLRAGQEAGTIGVVGGAGAIPEGDEAIPNVPGHGTA